MQQQISYDIDWSAAYDAWKASGQSKAQFWKTGLKQICKGSAFPTYNRFVKRIQDVEQRRQYMEMSRNGNKQGKSNEMADYVLQLSQKQDDATETRQVSINNNAKLISVVEVQFPSGLKVRVKTTDPTTLMYSLMQKECCEVA